MSFTQVPDIVDLLAAIDAGKYKTVSARATAIEQAGGKDFVQLQIIRQWLADSGSGGSGDVVGPGSSPDLAVAFFDGITGKLIRVSPGVAIRTDANGNLIVGDNTSTGVGTATPATLDLGGTYAASPVGSQAKWKLYNAGSLSGDIFGIGISAAQFNFFTGPGASYRWHFNDVRQMMLNEAGVLALNGLVTAVRIFTTSDTVDSAPGDYTIVGNSNGSAITATMVAASANTGRILSFKNKGSATMTVDATSLGQIFSTALVNTIVLATGDAMVLQSDGTNWLLC